MEKETSTFDGWIKTADQETKDLDRNAALQALADMIATEFGAHLWFVEILGRRWSYLAGEKRELPAESEVSRIRLSSNIGLVIETWGNLKNIEQEKFCEYLNRMVSQTPRQIKKRRESRH